LNQESVSGNSPVNLEHAGFIFKSQRCQSILRLAISGELAETLGVLLGDGCVSK